MEAATDLVGAVHQLKVDRDTWQAVALQYKSAFQAQTARLRELQDICFATQAELENERAQHCRLQLGLNGVTYDCPLASDSDDDLTDDQAFGTAIILAPSHVDLSWKLDSLRDDSNPIFKSVHQCASQRNYGTALVEIERLLRGPLSPKARAEGLLLQTSILRAIGPDYFYDALAACSEALELCDRVSDLQTLLPKIQYQRGLCYYQLHMLQKARKAFRTVEEHHLLFEEAHDYRQLCDDELEMLRSDRRSAFDESRSMLDDLIAQVDVDLSHGRLWRTSAHLKFRATQKAKRLSLPHRWVSSSTDLSSKTDEV